MKRSILASALVLLGLSSSAIGCSQADTVCNTICDCEHCNDQVKIQTCDSLTTLEDWASAYDCSDQWDAYMTCKQDRGICDTTEARYSTQDSTTKQDKCQDELDSLTKCVDAASAHGGTNINFNF